LEFGEDRFEFFYQTPEIELVRDSPWMGLGHKSAEHCWRIEVLLHRNRPPGGLLFQLDYPTRGLDRCQVFSFRQRSDLDRMIG
jgi:hypothetical protein